MRNLRLSWMMFANPCRAFTELRAKPTAWFPLLFVILCSAATAAWSLALTETGALREMMGSGDVSADSPMPATKSGMISVQVTVTVFILLLARLFESLYFSIAGSLVSPEITFRHWLALSCWSAMPHVLGALAFLAAVLTTGRAPGSLISLNTLVAHIPAPSPWARFFDGILITHLWVWALTVVGAKIWTRRSTMFCIGFALLPVFVIQAGRALAALL